MSRYLPLVALVVPFVISSSAFCQNVPEETALQREALKNNHDLRVAEAELRLAEARFEAARAKLRADLTLVILEVEESRKLEKRAIEWEQVVERLRKRGAISEEEHVTYRMKTVKLMAEARAAEARLVVVLGQPAKAPLDKELDFDKLHAEALKNNADYRVEEARLSLAKTEFARVRSNLLLRVNVAERELKIATVAEQEGQVRLKRGMQLFAQKAISREELEDIEANAANLERERRVAEARLQALLGGPLDRKTTPAK